MPAKGQKWPAESLAKRRAIQLLKPMPPERKFCPSCRTEKPRDCFGLRRCNPRWLRGQCRDCESKYSRKAYDPERGKINNRRGSLKRRNASHEWYESKFREQREVCAICANLPPRRKLAIDHDHLTGEKRGLLCDRCNIGLGYFKDSPKMLETAAAYLRQYSK